MPIYPHILVRRAGLSFAHLAPLACTVAEIKQFCEQMAHRQTQNAACEWLDEQLKMLRTYLQYLSQDENLNWGLLQSSISFRDRLPAFRHKALEDFRKKDYQRERALLQYLNRICTKTSPFSTFCKVGIYDWQQATWARPIRKKYIQLNLAIVKALYELPYVKRTLPLVINPTLLEEGRDLKFLVKKTNTTKIQTVGKDIFLTHVLEVLSEKSYTLEALSAQLLASVEADEMVIQAYIEELIEAGVLAHQFDPASVLKIALAATPKLQKHLQFCLQCTFLDEQHFLKISDDLMLFLKEKIPEKTFSQAQLFYTNSSFYEAQHQPIIKTEIAPLKHTLNTLFQYLKPLQSSRNCDLVADCLRTHFADKKEIAILDFYATFLKYYQFEKAPIAADIKAYWQKGLKAIITPAVEGIISLSLNEIAELSKESPQGTPSLPYPDQVSVLVQQIANKDAQNTSYILNGIALGYGKLLGRFLPLFEANILTKIQAQNTSKSTVLYLENKDDSTHTANVKAPLLPYELSNINSTNELAPAQQIPLSDIVINWQEKPFQYHLASRKSGKRIELLDLGLQHPSERTLIYQLLNLFAPQTPTLQVFNRILQEVSLQNRGEAGYFQAAIKIENIVLQRATWWLDKSKIPTRKPLEEDAHYFYRILLWKAELNLPRHIFISLAPREYPFEVAENAFFKAKKDDYKPQYIDLHSPLQILLLERLLKRAASWLKISEMRPIPETYAEELACSWC